MSGKEKKTIYQWRSEKNMTQQELAIKAGVAQATISELENNKRKKGAMFANILKIANALGVSVEEIEL